MVAALSAGRTIAYKVCEVYGRFGREGYQVRRRIRMVRTSMGVGPIHPSIEQAQVFAARNGLGLCADWRDVQ